MRQNWSKRFFQTKTILILSGITGAVLGILFEYFVGSKYMDSAGIMSDYFLQTIQSAVIEERKLFWYVLESRLSSLLFLWLMGLTSLGILLSAGFFCWTGFSAGLLLATVCLKFQWKGILLFMGSVFPHYLIYLPVLFRFLQMVFGTSLQIKGALWEKSNRKTIFDYGIHGAAFIGVYIIGIILECYVGYPIFQILLKKF